MKRLVSYVITQLACITDCTWASVGLVECLHLGLIKALTCLNCEARLLQRRKLLIPLPESVVRISEVNVSTD